MPRQRARPLILAEGLVAALLAHIAAHPGDWFKTPPIVARGAKVSHADGPFPCIVVTIDEGAIIAGETISDGGIEERERLALVVYGLVESPDPEEAAVELMSDIRRAVGLNRQLTLGAKPPLLPDGYIHFDSFKINHAPADAGSRGECVVRLSLDYFWTPSTA